MPDLPVKLPARFRAGILRLTARKGLRRGCRRAAVLLPLVLLSLVLPPGIRAQPPAPAAPDFGAIHYAPGYLVQDTVDNTTGD